MKFKLLKVLHVITLAFVLSIVIFSAFYLLDSYAFISASSAVFAKGGAEIDVVAYDHTMGIVIPVLLGSALLLLIIEEIIYAKTYKKHMKNKFRKSMARRDRKNKKLFDAPVAETEPKKIKKTKVKKIKQKKEKKQKHKDTVENNMVESLQEQEIKTTNTIPEPQKQSSESGQNQLSNFLKNL